METRERPQVLREDSSSSSRPSILSDDESLAAGRLEMESILSENSSHLDLGDLSLENSEIISQNSIPPSNSDISPSKSSTEAVSNDYLFKKPFNPDLKVLSPFTTRKKIIKNNIDKENNPKRKVSVEFSNIFQDSFDEDLPPKNEIGRRVSVNFSLDNSESDGENNAKKPFSRRVSVQFPDNLNDESNSSSLSLISEEEEESILGQDKKENLRRSFKSDSKFPQRRVSVKFSLNDSDGEMSSSLSSPKTCGKIIKNQNSKTPEVDISQNSSTIGLSSPFRRSLRRSSATVSSVFDDTGILDDSLLARIDNAITCNRTTQSNTSELSSFGKTSQNSVDRSSDADLLDLLSSTSPNRNIQFTPDEPVKSPEKESSISEEIQADSSKSSLTKNIDITELDGIESNNSLEKDVFSHERNSKSLRSSRKKSNVTKSLDFTDFNDEIESDTSSVISTQRSVKGAKLLAKRVSVKFSLNDTESETSSKKNYTQQKSMLISSENVRESNDENYDASLVKSTEQEALSEKAKQTHSLKSLRSSIKRSNLKNSMDFTEFNEIESDISSLISPQRYVKDAKSLAKRVSVKFSLNATDSESDTPSKKNFTPQKSISVSSEKDSESNDENETMNDASLVESLSEKGVQAHSSKSLDLPQRKSCQKKSVEISEFDGIESDDSCLKSPQRTTRSKKSPAKRVSVKFSFNDNDTNSESDSPSKKKCALQKSMSISSENGSESNDENETENGASLVKSTEQEPLPEKAKQTLSSKSLRSSSKKANLTNSLDVTEIDEMESDTSSVKYHQNSVKGAKSLAKRVSVKFSLNDSDSESDTPSKKNSAPQKPMSILSEIGSESNYENESMNDDAPLVKSTEKESLPEKEIQAHSSKSLKSSSKKSNLTNSLDVTEFDEIESYTSSVKSPQRSVKGAKSLAKRVSVKFSLNDSDSESETSSKKNSTPQKSMSILSENGSESNDENETMNDASHVKSTEKESSKSLDLPQRKSCLKKSVEISEFDGIDSDDSCLKSPQRPTRSKKSPAKRVSVKFSFNDNDTNSESDSPSKKKFALQKSMSISSENGSESNDENETENGASLVKSTEQEPLPEKAKQTLSSKSLRSSSKKANLTSFLDVTEIDQMESDTSSVKYHQRSVKGAKSLAKRVSVKFSLNDSDSESDTPSKKNSAPQKSMSILSEIGSESNDENETMNDASLVKSTEKESLPEKEKQSHSSKSLRSSSKKSNLTNSLDVTEFDEIESDTSSVKSPQRSLKAAKSLSKRVSVKFSLNDIESESDTSSKKNSTPQKSMSILSENVSESSDENETMNDASLVKSTEKESLKSLDLPQRKSCLKKNVEISEFDGIDSDVSCLNSPQRPTRSKNSPAKRVSVKFSLNDTDSDSVLLSKKNSTRQKSMSVLSENGIESNDENETMNDASLVKSPKKEVLPEQEKQTHSSKYLKSSSNKLNVTNSLDVTEFDGIESDSSSVKSHQRSVKGAKSLAKRVSVKFSLNDSDSECETSSKKNSAPQKSMSILSEIGSESNGENETMNDASRVKSTEQEPLPEKAKQTLSSKSLRSSSKKSNLTNSLDVTEFDGIESDASSVKSPQRSVKGAKSLAKRVSVKFSLNDTDSESDTSSKNNSTPQKSMSILSENGSESNDENETMNDASLAKSTEKESLKSLDLPQRKSCLKKNVEISEFDGIDSDDSCLKSPQRTTRSKKSPAKRVSVKFSLNDTDSESVTFSKKNSTCQKSLSVLSENDLEDKDENKTDYDASSAKSPEKGIQVQASKSLEIPKRKSCLKRSLSQDFNLNNSEQLRNRSMVSDTRRLSVKFNDLDNDCKSSCIGKPSLSTISEDGISFTSESLSMSSTSGSNKPKRRLSLKFDLEDSDNERNSSLNNSAELNQQTDEPSYNLMMVQNSKTPEKNDGLSVSALSSPTPPRRNTRQSLARASSVFDDTKNIDDSFLAAMDSVLLKRKQFKKSLSTSLPNPSINTSSLATDDKSINVLADLTSYSEVIMDISVDGKNKKRAKSKKSLSTSLQNPIINKSSPVAHDQSINVLLTPDKTTYSEVNMDQSFPLSSENKIMKKTKKSLSSSLQKISEDANVSKSRFEISISSSRSSLKSDPKILNTLPDTLLKLDNLDLPNPSTFPTTDENSSYSVASPDKTSYSEVVMEQDISSDNENKNCQTSKKSLSTSLQNRSMNTSVSNSRFDESTSDCRTPLKSVSKISLDEATQLDKLPSSDIQIPLTTPSGTVKSSNVVLNKTLDSEVINKQDLSDNKIENASVSKFHVENSKSSSPLKTSFESEPQSDKLNNSYSQVTSVSPSADDKNIYVDNTEPRSLLKSLKHSSDVANLTPNKSYNLRKLSSSFNQLKEDSLKKGKTTDESKKLNEIAKSKDIDMELSSNKITSSMTGNDLNVESDVCPLMITTGLSATSNSQLGAGQVPQSSEESLKHSSDMANLTPNKSYNLRKLSSSFNKLKEDSHKKRKIINESLKLNEIAKDTDMELCSKKIIPSSMTGNDLNVESEECPLMIPNLSETLNSQLGTGQVMQSSEESLKHSSDMANLTPNKSYNLRKLSSSFNKLKEDSHKKRKTINESLKLNEIAKSKDTDMELCPKKIIPSSMTGNDLNVESEECPLMIPSLSETSKSQLVPGQLMQSSEEYISENALEARNSLSKKPYNLRESSVFNESQNLKITKANNLKMTSPGSKLLLETNVIEPEVRSLNVPCQSLASVNLTTSSENKSSEDVGKLILETRREENENIFSKSAIVSEKQVSVDEIISDKTSDSNMSKDQDVPNKKRKRMISPSLQNKSDKMSLSRNQLDNSNTKLRSSEKSILKTKSDASRHSRLSPIPSTSYISGDNPSGAFNCPHNVINSDNKKRESSSVSRRINRSRHDDLSVPDHEIDSVSIPRTSKEHDSVEPVEKVSTISSVKNNSASAQSKTTAIDSPRHSRSISPVPSASRTSLDYPSGTVNNEVVNHNANEMSQNSSTLSLRISSDDLSVSENQINRVSICCASKEQDFAHPNEEVPTVTSILKNRSDFAKSKATIDSSRHSRHVSPVPETSHASMEQDFVEPDEEVPTRSSVTSILKNRPDLAKSKATIDSSRHSRHVSPVPETSHASMEQDFVEPDEELPTRSSVTSILKNRSDFAKSKATIDSSRHSRRISPIPSTSRASKENDFVEPDEKITTRSSAKSILKNISESSKSKTTIDSSRHSRRISPVPSTSRSPKKHNFVEPNTDSKERKSSSDLSPLATSLNSSSRFENKKSRKSSVKSMLRNGSHTIDQDIGMPSNSSAPNFFIVPDIPFRKPSLKRSLIAKSGMSPKSKEQKTDHNSSYSSYLEEFINNKRKHGVFHSTPKHSSHVEEFNNNQTKRGIYQRSPKPTSDVVCQTSDELLNLKKSTMNRYSSVQTDEVYSSATFNKRKRLSSNVPFKQRVKFILSTNDSTGTSYRSSSMMSSLTSRRESSQESHYQHVRFRDRPSLIDKSNFENDSTSDESGIEPLRPERKETTHHGRRVSFRNRLSNIGTNSENSNDNLSRFSSRFENVSQASGITAYNSDIEEPSSPIVTNHSPNDFVSAEILPIEPNSINNRTNSVNPMENSQVSELCLPDDFSILNTVKLKNIPPIDNTLVNCDDLRYDPRFQQPKKDKFPDKWVSKKFIEYLTSKLRTSCQDKASIEAQHLISLFCAAVNAVEILNEPTDIEATTLLLRKCLVKYNICTTTLEYYLLLWNYTPQKFRNKVFSQVKSKMGDAIV